MELPKSKSYYNFLQENASHYNLRMLKQNVFLTLKGVLSIAYYITELDLPVSALAYLLLCVILTSFTAGIVT